MLLVDDILCFPVRSILWIFREIAQIADDELAGESESITEQLRILYMQLETGRISEQQFEVEEKLLLDRLDAVERRLKSGEDGEEEAEDSDVAALREPGDL